MTSTVPLDQRLYGAAQQLLLAQFAGMEGSPAVPRGLVEQQDAIDALQLALAAIQEQAQAARIDPPAAARMVALLMVVRDYIRPLPPGIAQDGSDQLTTDLAQMVEAVRLTRW